MRKAATLTPRFAAFSKLPTLIQSQLFRSTMRGVKRKRGVAQRQARPPMRGDLLDLLARMGGRPNEVVGKVNDALVACIDGVEVPSLVPQLIDIMPNPPRHQVG